MITQDLLNEIFTLSSDGNIVWVKPKKRVRSGDVAGSINSYGYRVIRLNKKLYTAHRLVWLMVHGYLPENHIDHIDHINGNKLDNRITNLREATHQQNAQNKIIPSTRNKLKILGVSAKGDKFIANVWSRGKNKYLGSFKSPELAHEAYIIEKRKAHDFCTL